MDLQQSASSVVTTERAARLAKQFISHWGRHTTPVQDGDGVVMSFEAGEAWPASAVRVEAQPGQLLLTAWADDTKNLETNCESIAEHLQRFAGKNETLTFDWN